MFLIRPNVYRSFESNLQIILSDDNEMNLAVHNKVFSRFFFAVRLLDFTESFFSFSLLCIYQI